MPTSPYIVERTEAGYRIVGPGMCTKVMPADAIQKLDDAAALLNFAYRRGVDDRPATVKTHSAAG